MIHGIKRIFNSPIYTYLKKHRCPKCGGLLSVIKVSKVVNSRSKEADDYDFISGDTSIAGNIKFILNEYYCNQCHYQVGIKKMKQIELEKTVK